MMRNEDIRDRKHAQEIENKTMQKFMYFQLYILMTGSYWGRMYIEPWSYFSKTQQKVVLTHKLPVTKKFPYKWLIPSHFQLCIREKEPVLRHTMRLKHGKQKTRSKLHLG